MNDLPQNMKTSSKAAIILGESKVASAKAVSFYFFR